MRHHTGPRRVLVLCHAKTVSPAPQVPSCAPTLALPQALDGSIAHCEIELRELLQQSPGTPGHDAHLNMMTAILGPGDFSGAPRIAIRADGPSGRRSIT
jgi:hypothetical protein